MLRYTLKRVLWILPSLLVATWVLFWFVSQARPLEEVRRSDDGGVRDAERAGFREQKLPLFFNFKPRDIRGLTKEAMDLARAEDTMDVARRMFTYLGGASLPYVLPQLDAMDPVTRRRVAVSLEAVAMRMGLLGEQGFVSRDDAVVFWTTFWEERAEDFRPTVVRRAVRRLSESDSAARRAVVVEFDTYALADIFLALTAQRIQGDAKRVARLLDVASHIIARDECASDSLEVAQLRQCARVLGDWWVAHYADFQVLSGLQWMSSVLTETQYGKWVLEALVLQLGVSDDGQTVWSRVKAHAPRTIGLLMTALVFAYVLALAFAFVTSYWRGGKLSLLALLGLGATIVIPFPVMAVVVAGLTHGSMTMAAVLLVTTLALVAVPSRQQQLAAVAAASGEYLTYAKARGLSPLRVMLVHIGSIATPVALSTAAFDFPLAMSIVCVAEHALSVPGLGPQFVDAVVHHDVAFLMAAGMLGVLCQGALMMVCDMVSALIDSRTSPSCLQENPWL